MVRHRAGYRWVVGVLGPGIGLLLAGLASSVVAQTHPGPMMNHAPVWSPTRNLIAFDSDRGGVPAVYIINPDERTLRPISDGRSPACCARWSRDGAHLNFEVDRDGTRQTLRVSVDGGSAVEVSGADRATESQAADGAALVLVEQEGHSLVTLVADGLRVQLTRGTWASQPAFSPNGQLIVYEDRDGDDIMASRIVAMDRAGAGRRTLGLGTDPSWSPDGSLILFKTPTDQVGGFGWQLAIGRPYGPLVTRLAPGVHPTWSPDGSRIAFMAESGRTRTDIWVMSSDGATRRCLTCTH